MKSFFIFFYLFKFQGIWWHLYISVNFAIIGSDNDLLLVQCQAITKPIVTYGVLVSWQHISVKLESKDKNFLQQNTSQQVVCKKLVVLLRPWWECVNSLWSNDAIWQHRSGSTMVQVMVCFLTAPSHYMNRCLVLISEVLWHPSEKFYIEWPRFYSVWSF